MTTTMAFSNVSLQSPVVFQVAMNDNFRASIQSFSYQDFLDYVGGYPDGFIAADEVPVIPLEPIVPPKPSMPMVTMTLFIYGVTAKYSGYGLKLIVKDEEKTYYSEIVTMHAGENKFQIVIQDKIPATASISGELIGTDAYKFTEESNFVGERVYKFQDMQVRVTTFNNDLPLPANDCNTTNAMVEQILPIVPKGNSVHGPTLDRKLVMRDSTNAVIEPLFENYYPYSKVMTMALEYATDIKINKRSHCKTKSVLLHHKVDVDVEEEDDVDGMTYKEALYKQGFLLPKFIIHNTVQLNAFWETTDVKNKTKLIKVNQLMAQLSAWAAHIAGFGRSEEILGGGAALEFDDAVEIFPEEVIRELTSIAKSILSTSSV